MMNTRKLAKILCIAVVALAFISAPLYAAPKENKGNNGKAQSKKSKVNPSSAAKAKTPLPHLQYKASVVRNQTLNKTKSDSTAKINRPKFRIQKNHRIHADAHKHKTTTLNNLNQSLKNLEIAKWAYHPRDDRGQGNMGKVDMLDPYGHDKDSDRMELYGNRGRVIRDPAPEPEPDPVPEPEPDPVPEPDPEPDPIPEPDPEPEPPQEPPDFPF